MKIGYYIYKYVYDGEVIYVGKTDSDLNARIRSHAAEFKFQKYIDKANIFYYECKNAAHTALLEIYYINKYKPKLNVSMKYDDDLEIYIKDVEWLPIDNYFPKPVKQLSKPLIRMGVLEQRIKAICYFYRLYRQRSRRNSICTVRNVATSKDADEIIAKYRLPLYYQNADGSMSYHPTIHHCNYDEAQQKLTFWINENLYLNNFAKNPKGILRANRDKIKIEMAEIRKRLQNKKEVM